MPEFYEGLAGFPQNSFPCRLSHNRALGSHSLASHSHSISALAPHPEHRPLAWSCRGEGFSACAFTSWFFNRKILAKLLSFCCFILPTAALVGRCAPVAVLTFPVAQQSAPAGHSTDNPPLTGSLVCLAKLHLPPLTRHWRFSPLTADEAGVLIFQQVKYRIHRLHL